MALRSPQQPPHRCLTSHRSKGSPSNFLVKLIALNIRHLGTFYENRLILATVVLSQYTYLQTTDGQTRTYNNSRTLQCNYGEADVEHRVSDHSVQQLDRSKSLGVLVRLLTRLLM